jgi:hypothetical protein
MKLLWPRLIPYCRELVVFFIVTHFYPCLIFVNMAGAYQSGAPRLYV